jgi:flagellar hook-basal body complex protein FliE
MSISGPISATSLTSFQPLSTGQQSGLRSPATQPTAEISFSDRMGDAVKDTANAQNQAKDSAKDYELGTENDLSKVMIDQQVASLSFQMALNVRNKALGAYKDIMNMPV